MTRIQHLTLPDVQREVPTDEAVGWLEAGWVAADDAPPEVDTDPDEVDLPTPQPLRTTKTKEGTK